MTHMTTKFVHFALSVTILVRIGNCNANEDDMTSINDFFASHPEYSKLKYPEVHMDTCELLRTKGYPCEVHFVDTDDGYILTLHRIPHGVASGPESGKPVVFLQHGFIGASDDWVINLENQSLGYLLADSGFDVWMGNIRGNRYSRSHLELDRHDRNFWMFSFDHHSLRDLPAMIEYSLRFAGQRQLQFVGYSQGNLMGFIQFSEDPDWTKQHIREFHVLAPVAYMRHITSPLKHFAPLVGKTLRRFLEMISIGQFLPNKSLLRRMTGKCGGSGHTANVCSALTFIISGFNERHMNITRMPIYVAHTPAGTSVRNVLHWGQLIKAQNLRAFDFGSRMANMKAYGSYEPPEYDPGRINIPTYLYWGDVDDLGDPDDVKILENRMNSSIRGSFMFRDVNHLEFVWGLNAPQFVYPKLIRTLKEGLQNAE